MHKKIFVIDDDDGIQDAFRVVLESEGYLVQTYSGGEIFDELADDLMPDLIILDMLLSGEDGRNVCRKLKQDVVRMKIPVIMVSAKPHAEEEAFESGADDFIKKPFEIDEFLTKVSNCLNRPR